MLLTKQLEALTLERSLEPGTEQNYARSVRYFGEWLGRPATVADLDEKLVNAWLKSIEGTRSGRTVLGHKRSITVLWNWLAEQGLTRDYDARRLRAVKVDPVIPNAWSLENCHALLRGAETLTGRLRCGIDASDLMKAWILVGYESGLRPSDLRRLKPENINGNILSIVQHKTNVPHSCELTDGALQMLKRIQVEDGRLFPASRNTIRRWELRLYAAAKDFGFVRRKRQGIGTLRKTHGTEVCRAQGLEAAARSLGHISGTSIARAYYVAPEALPIPAAPPRLTHDGFNPPRTPTSDRDSSRRAG